MHQTGFGRKRATPINLETFLTIFCPKPFFEIRSVLVFVRWTMRMVLHPFYVKRSKTSWDLLVLIQNIFDWSIWHLKRWLLLSTFRFENYDVSYNRRATVISRRVIVPRAGNYFPAKVCVLVSPSDCDSLLRVVFDVAALLLRSYSY